jgi:hypothetical protein
LNRVAEPAVLFPAIGIVMLTAIWAATFGVVKLKHSDAEHVASVSTRELRDTYEARVASALHEIDQTLNLVKYSHEDDGRRRALAELRDKGLLPPDLLFNVSIADRRGTITDSTRTPQKQDVSGDDFFRKQLESDAFFIGQPARNPTVDKNLYFSR